MADITKVGRDIQIVQPDFKATSYLEATINALIDRTGGEVVEDEDEDEDEVVANERLVQVNFQATGTTDEIIYEVPSDARQAVIVKGVATSLSNSGTDTFSLGITTTGFLTDEAFFYRVTDLNFFETLILDAMESAVLTRSNAERIICTSSNFMNFHFSIKEFLE